MRELLHGAAPGSDEQLAFAVAFIDAASAPADLDLLAGAADGGAVVIDGPGHRHRHALAAAAPAGQPGRGGPRGRSTPELDRDRTDAGERHAASAGAAIPSPEAKEAAWDQIIGGAMPNATFRAALGGFQDMDQDELVAPYAGRYFEVVAGIWRDWGSDMAQYFTVAAYPGR